MRQLGEGSTAWHPTRRPEPKPPPASSGWLNRLERKRPLDFSETALNPLYAEQAREEGHRLLTPPEALTGHAGTELVPTPTSDERLTDTRMEFLETRNQQNSTNVASSEQRADLATRAGVLPSALDAAVSVHADGPIEKMLCHQLAAAHKAGMGLLIRVEEGSRLPPVEAARLTNAAARLFEVCQSAALAVQKLKLRGTQRVTCSRSPWPSRRRGHEV